MIDAHDLGPALEPALDEECGGRLSDIRWFHKRWQRGGAATAHATYRCDDDVVRPVVVKLPVGPIERRSLTDLAVGGPPIPSLVASGDDLGHYHFAWVVMEQVDAEPPMNAPKKADFSALCTAATRFCERASTAWGNGSLENRSDWSSLIEKSREIARAGGFALAAEWARELKATHKLVPKAVTDWLARPCTGWVHGDLHIGNLLHRPGGSAWGEAAPILIDYAEARPGHWVEDAVYLERTFWSHRQDLDGAKPVSLMAKSRRDAGMDLGGDYAHLADVRRFLKASCVPAMLHVEGDEHYLAGSLEVLRSAASRLA